MGMGGDACVFPRAVIVPKVGRAPAPSSGKHGASGGAEKTIDKWDLNGCYLSNVQYGDLNYGTSEMVQVTATIRYDNASNEITGGVTDTLSGDPQTPAP